MRCPRWLGLPKGDLGGAPNLRQVPLSRRLLGKMPLLTCSQEPLSSGCCLSRKPHFLLAAPSCPEPMSRDKDRCEEEVYTDSLTSHTTASGSTTADILTSTVSAVERT